MFTKKKHISGSTAEIERNAGEKIATTSLAKRDDPPPSPPETAASATSQTPTKRALVLALLARDDGATLPELMAATGWQAHSVRAMLTGLRKSGIVLEKSIRNGATCYQILEASDAQR